MQFTNAIDNAIANTGASANQHLLVSVSSSGLSAPTELVPTTVFAAATAAASTATSTVTTTPIASITTTAASTATTNVTSVTLTATVTATDAAQSEGRSGGESGSKSGSENENIGRKENASENGNGEGNEKENLSNSQSGNITGDAEKTSSCELESKNISKECNNNFPSECCIYPNSSNSDVSVCDSMIGCGSGCCTEKETERMMMMVLRTQAWNVSVSHGMDIGADVRGACVPGGGGVKTHGCGGGN